MKISTTMDLGALAERMGDADADDARAMRDLLVYSCNGSDTEEVTESAWLEMLGQASAARIAHDIVTRADFSSAEALDAYAEVIGKDVRAVRALLSLAYSMPESPQTADLAAQRHNKLLTQVQAELKRVIAAQVRDDRVARTEERFDD